MLTEAQRRAFADDGFIRLPVALAAETVNAMRDRLWAELIRAGVDPSERSTWTARRATHLQAIRDADPAPADSPAVRAALDGVFGPGRWVAPRHWGQALVTFPVPGEWRLPTGPWHVDYPYWYPANAVWGANLFLFLDDVRPRGGGTLVVRSSHRVVARFVAGIEAADERVGARSSQLRRRFERGQPWFRDLATADGDDDGRIERFMGASSELDGIALRVDELVGAPGDAVLCHPWTVHAPSPNVSERPRLMRVGRIYNPAALTDAGRPAPEPSGAAAR